MLENDVFLFIMEIAADIAAKARTTVFTAFGLPVSLWEVWLTLFVLSALFSVVFVSRSYSSGTSENLAESEFSSYARTVTSGMGRGRGRGYGSSVSERNTTGNSSSSSRSSSRRSGWNVNLKL